MARHEIVASFWEEPVGPPVGYVRHRRGAVVDVPDEHVERLLRIGAIAPVEPDTAEDESSGNDEASPGNETPESADETPVVPATTDVPAGDTASADQPDASVEVADVERPKQAASKAIWVEYAVARGMDRDDAEAFEKRDLIAELD
ncbi:hypothetical protein R1X32_42750 [Rhodococcus opacus]|uniref:hypothetical protein n=1 Tax=Rhodococcus opacus TaxID=37919 RepID=UPI0034D3183A